MSGTKEKSKRSTSQANDSKDVTPVKHSERLRRTHVDSSKKNDHTGSYSQIRGNTPKTPKVIYLCSLH